MNERINGCRDRDRAIDLMDGWRVTAGCGSHCGADYYNFKRVEYSVLITGNEPIQLDGISSCRLN